MGLPALAGAVLLVAAVAAAGPAQAGEAPGVPDVASLREMFEMKGVLAEIDVMENMDLLLEYESLTEENHYEKYIDYSDGGTDDAGRHGSPGSN